MSPAVTPTVSASSVREQDIPSWVNKEAIPLLGALRTAANELRDDVDAIDTTLPDVGPGAGTYGGGGNYIESVTLDAKGRVTALTVDAPTGSGSASTEGSIFSMVGPGGAAAPIVAYDFTRYDASLTVAQNLANANMSGVAAYDLIQAGSAAIVFQSFSASGLATPYGFTPFACSPDGGALCGITGGSDYATTSGAPAGLQLLGAMSAEWLGLIPTTPTGNMILFDLGASGETEATNVLYLLQYSVGSNRWEYVHESGLGTDSTVWWFADNGGEASIVNKFSPLHMTITRDGTSGDVALYINGRLVGPPSDGSVTDFPTGGTSGNLQIGVGGTNTIPLTLGFRLFDVKLTAAQAQASYRRTFFGVST